MFDNINPTVLAVSVSALVTVVGIGALRPIVARVAMNRSFREAQPKIDQFAQNQTTKNFVSLTGTDKEIAGCFADAGKLARKMRDEALERARTIDIPTPKDIKNRKVVMKNTVIAIGALSTAYLTSVAKYRVAFVLSQDVQHNLAKVAKEIPARDIIDLHISTVLRETGITDLAATIAADLAMVHVPHVVGELVLGAAAIPGIGSIIPELKRLYNDETSLDDAIYLGAVPAAITALSLKGGAAAGATIGSAFFGFGAIPGALIGGFVGWCGAHFAKSKIIESEIDSDRALLAPHIHEIDITELEGVQVVNELIVDKFGNFKEVIESYPRIDDGKMTRALLERMAWGLEKDLSTFSAHIKKNQEKIINELPKRTWFDKLLGINRSDLIAEAYRQASDNIIATYKAQVEAYTNFLKDDFEKSAHLVNEGFIPIVKDGEFLKILRRLLLELVPALEEYDNRRTEWSTSLNARWAEGNKLVQEAESKRVSVFNTAVSRLRPQMAPLQRRLKTNYKRIGRRPDRSLLI